MAFYVLNKIDEISQAYLEVNCTHETGRENRAGPNPKPADCAIKYAG